MIVKYIGKMDFFDNLTTGKLYEVIRENDRQYMVNNDVGSTSSVQKTKFEIVV